MKRKRYSDEKIICILKEHEAGASAEDLSRRHGVAESTMNRWKAKFGGMGVTEARRLRELEAEILKLNRLLAEAELDKAALKELVEGYGQSGCGQQLTQMDNSFGTLRSRKRSVVEKRRFVCSHNYNGPGILGATANMFVR
jgi:putative transposase